MSRCLLVVLAALVPVAVMAAPGEVNQAAIDAVAAGKLRVAKASWWGFDPEDSTRALQAAIDSGARKVIVENLGQPWVVDRITLASNQEIFFERGVEVLAKKGSFRGTNDALFRANQKENLTLRGDGATLRMRRFDYAGPGYEKAEWRHCLSLLSCRNVRVYGLTLAESGGDGIYLGTGQAGVPNKNIHIKDVVCDRNYRQGISVINAENLLIENCLLQLTDGTAPRAGIDFEPNLTNERLVNCVMRNCTTRWNGGCGYAIYIPTLDASSLPVSLRFENCRSLGDRGSAVAIYTGNSPAAAVKGSIVFEDCTFEGSGQPGIVVANKPVNGCRLRFDRCVLRDVAQAMPEHSPIVLQAHDSASEPVGGITFSDCRVREATERRLLSYSDLAGGAGVAELSGRLIVERGAKRTVVRLTEQRLAEWIPAARMKVIPRLGLEGVALQPLAAAKAADYSLAGIRLRQRAHLVLFARQGEMVRLTLSYRQVAHYSGRALPLVITGPSGGEVTRAEVPFQQQSEVTFTAPETGVYQVAVDPGANYLQVDRSSHPLCLSAAERPVRLYSSPVELFFWVPPGTREFGVRVCGEGLSEAVKATLLDPQGKVVGEVDNQLALHQFVATPVSEAGEVWCLRLERPTKILMEDHFVDLRGVPPLLASSRDSLLIPAP